MWLHNKTHSCSVGYAFFSQTSYHAYKNNSPHFIKKQLTTFQYLTHLFPTFQWILPSVPHIFKRSGSWTTTLLLYLDRIIIWLNLLHAYLQLTVTSSNWNTSLYLFLGQLKLLPTNFLMTVKSSSYIIVTETTSEDKSLIKLSHTIILFGCISLMISSEKL